MQEGAFGRSVLQKTNDGFEIKGEERAGSVKTLEARERGNREVEGDDDETTHREDQSGSLNGSNGSSINDSVSVGIGDEEGGLTGSERVVQVEEEGEAGVDLRYDEGRKSAREASFVRRVENENDRATNLGIRVVNVLSGNSSVLGSCDLARRRPLRERQINQGQFRRRVSFLLEKREKPKHTAPST